MNTNKPTDQTPANRFERDFKNLSGPLATVAREIWVLQNNDTCTSALNHYERALKFKKVMDKASHYGDGAIQKLAKAVGVHISTVYEDIAVPRRWTQHKFKQLIARKGPAEKPLSWSHCREIAKLMDDQLSEQLIADVLSDDLSVREVMARMSARPAPRPGSAKPPPVTAPKSEAAGAIVSAAADQHERNNGAAPQPPMPSPPAPDDAEDNVPDGPADVPMDRRSRSGPDGYDLCVQLTQMIVASRGRVEELREEKEVLRKVLAEGDGARDNEFQKLLAEYRSTADEEQRQAVENRDFANTESKAVMHEAQPDGAVSGKRSKANKRMARMPVKSPSARLRA